MALKSGVGMSTKSIQKKERSEENVSLKPKQACDLVQLQVQMHGVAERSEGEHRVELRDHLRNDVVWNAVNLGCEY